MLLKQCLLIPILTFRKNRMHYQPDQGAKPRLVCRALSRTEPLCQAECQSADLDKGVDAGSFGKI